MKASRISEHLYADTSGEGKGNISAVELPTSTVVVDSTVSPEIAFAFRSSTNPRYNRQYEESLSPITTQTTHSACRLSRTVI
jgi:hypothetical protein